MVLERKGFQPHRHPRCISRRIVTVPTNESIAQSVSSRHAIVATMTVQTRRCRRTALVTRARRHTQ